MKVSRTMVQNLADLLRSDLADETRDLAVGGLWFNGVYGGPGHNPRVFRTGLLLAYLEWYIAADETSERGIDPPEPPLWVDPAKLIEKG